MKENRELMDKLASRTSASTNNPLHSQDTNILGSTNSSQNINDNSNVTVSVTQSCMCLHYKWQQKPWPQWSTALFVGSQQCEGSLRQNAGVDEKLSLTGGLLWGWSLAVDFSIGTPCPEQKLLAPCSQPLDCCHSTGSANSVWGWVPSKTGLTSIPLQTLQLQAPFLHTFAPPHLRFWNKNTSTHPTPPWSFDSIFYVLTFSTHTIHTSNILPTDHGCVMEEVEAVTDAETGTGFLPVLFPSSCHCCSTWLHRPLMSAAAYQWFPYMHAGGVLVHLFGITCILLGSVIFPPWFKIKLVLFF